LRVFFKFDLSAKFLRAIADDISAFCLVVNEPRLQVSCVKMSEKMENLLNDGVNISVILVLMKNDENLAIEFFNIFEQSFYNEIRKAKLS